LIVVDDSLFSLRGEAVGYPEKGPFPNNGGFGYVCQELNLDFFNRSSDSDSSSESYLVGLLNISAVSFNGGASRVGWNSDVPRYCVSPFFFFCLEGFFLVCPRINILQI